MRNEAQQLPGRKLLMRNVVAELDHYICARETRMLTDSKLDTRPVTLRFGSRSVVGVCTGSGTRRLLLRVAVLRALVRGGDVARVEVALRHAFIVARLHLRVRSGLL